MVENQNFKYIYELCNYLDEQYPKELAWDDDLPRIGLILGDKRSKINNVLLSLDVNEDVIDEAIKKNVNLIITHHPLIFRPIYKIDYESSLGRVIIKLIKNNIALYSMHTNLDVGIGGVADSLASNLKLNNIEGENEKDSYLRVGYVDGIKFKDILKYIHDSLSLNGLKYAGNSKKQIKKIGIFGGSGGSDYFVEDAISKNLDLYISSEFKLSAVQLAVNNDLCIIEINHGTEKIVFKNLQEKLNSVIANNIFISEINSDPFNYYIKEG